jgi:hypothetical protein
MSSGLYSGVSGLALGIGLYRNVSGLWGGASGLIDGFGGGDPYAGASLYLNFLDPTLDSRITFSRGTNATLVDSTGKLTYAPNNQVLRSEEFNDAAWSKNNATVIANAATAPDGTATADLMVSAVGTAITGANSSSVTFAAGSYIQSVYVKAATGIRYIQLLWTSGGVSANYANFDLQTGTVTAGTYAYASMTAVGDGWYRISMGSTVGAATGGMWPIAVPAAASARAASYTGNGTDSFLIWGAQLEAVTYQTTPGPYVATTASAYYGPRFDYDPVTLAPRGLLIEEARTNLLTYSEDFTNAAWSKSTCTITANSTAAPNGTAVADTMVSQALTAFTYCLQTATFATATYTASVFVKASGAGFIQLLWTGAASTDYANFNITTGAVTAGTYAGATVTPFGSGWYRITLTSAIAAGAYGFYISLVDSGSAARAASFTGDGAKGAYLFGAQTELGAFATSYIPTVASTVSRSADVATMTGTNFSTWYNQAAGTFVIDADSYTIGSADYPLTASDGTSNNRFGFYRTTATIAGYVTTGAVDQMYLTRGSIATNIPYKAAVTATANDGNMALNGTAAAGDTSITMPTLDRLSIGSNNSSGFMSGHIRAIAYYNTRLPNTQLQTLTAPSLASPLALDFISPTYTVGY